MATQDPFSKHRVGQSEISAGAPSMPEIDERVVVQINNMIMTNLRLLEQVESVQQDEVKPERKSGNDLGEFNQQKKHPLNNDPRTSAADELTSPVAWVEDPERYAELQNEKRLENQKKLGLANSSAPRFNPY